MNLVQLYVYGKHEASIEKQNINERHLSMERDPFSAKNQTL